MSLRTSSAASDKSKKSGASPLHQQQPALPHTISETGQLPSTLAQSSKRTPEHAGIEDTHAAKHARAEVVAPQGFNPPPKIDEE